MQLQEFAEGTWRWETHHPEAVDDPEPGSADDWPASVGSVAYAAEDALVLIDPLVDADDWAELDSLVERHGQPVRVLTTIRWHGRSRDQIANRYGASTSRAKRSLPRGVETITIRGAGETMVWLSGPRALVPGDRLLGDGQGGVRVCPASWLRYLPSRISVEELRRRLASLLELPIELVLVTHGEPVLSGGRAAVRSALGGTRRVHGCAEASASS